VPGFFFIVLALYLWFSRWNHNDWKRLSLIGLSFGLAMVTKYQYLLFLAPTLILSWFLDIFYYKTSSHRNFLIPGIFAAGTFGLWQLVTLRYLGPATMMENLALLRASAEGAAFNLNLHQLGLNVGELTSRDVFLEALFPAALYGFFKSIPRTQEGQRWSVLYLLLTLNLGWYVVFSIGWIRYAFLGLSLATIFIARFFFDITSGFKFDWGSGYLRSLFENKNAYQFAVTLWLLAIILMPMAKTVMNIVLPGPDYATQMSTYLDKNVPQTAVIETWEPEMGFLTNHNYHFPPQALLAVAINQVYYNGAPVSDQYTYLASDKPEYLLVGEFSKWTAIYPADQIQANYQLVESFGDYDIYKRVAK
jgi:hypothetical protein